MFNVVKEDVLLSFAVSLLDVTMDLLSQRKIVFKFSDFRARVYLPNVDKTRMLNRRS